jgi:FtsH-binding integral membrane protein
MFKTESTHSVDDPKTSIVDDFMYGNSVATSHVTIRLGFIRKVYGILSVQLLFTTLVGAVIIASSSIQEFLKSNPWILLINLLGTLVILFALMAKRTHYPVNFYLLAAFTFFESLSVGFIASLYDISTVVQAFSLTTIVVIGLTAYTFQSKRDFKSGGAILFSLLTILIFGGFFQIIFQNEVLHTGLAIAGAFLFSAFIVFDTQMIMKTLNPEEYIVGVINLYLDIINLFLEILKIIDAMKKN